MKRMNLEHGKLIVVRTMLAAVLVACVMVSSSASADDDGKIQLRAKAGQRSYDDNKPQISTSSASASSSSFSQSDSRGRTRSKSTATATARGNASAVGSAKGNAGFVQTKNGQGTRLSNSSSSARAKANGNDVSGDRYQSRKDLKSSDQASATTSVTKNGVRISRSVKATEAGKVTTLEVISRMDEISMRENSDGAIEVRVRDRRKNADGNVNEKVFSAASRDELMKQSPMLVRRIKAYEKIAGTTKASVNTQDATASGVTKGGKFDAMVGNQDRNAKQMLKQQLEKTLQQNAGNPDMQELIRKMILDINQ